MKKIAVSLLTIMAVVVMATGATGAYFTDQEEVKGMTFATGTVSINNVSDSWMTHVSFVNLKPGDSVRKWVKISNDGTLDVASLKINAINELGDLELLDQLRVAVYGQVNGYDQGIYTVNWGAGQPVSTELVDLDVLGTAVYRNATAAHVLEPGKVDTLILDFKLPQNLGDEWQGKSVSFDLLFDAEQSHEGESYF